MRLLGNKAAHGRSMNAQTSLYLIEESYLLGQWFYKTYSGDISGHYPPYRPPAPATRPSEAPNDLARQLAEAKLQLARLAAFEQAALAKTAARHQSLDQARIRDFKAGATQASTTIDFKPAAPHRQISIRDAFSQFDLSEGQSELVDRLGEFLEGNAQSVFLLKGYAGTGKTFIMKGLTEYFRAIGRNYILAAPTGKASKVIASKTKSEAHTIHKTIYSFDDIAEYRDGDEEGTETFKFFARLRVNNLSADTVYIVDEASMVSDMYQEAEFFRFGTGFLLRDFLKFVNLDHNDHSKKVIFVGDNAQLPPVGMSFSPALDADYLRREHHVRSTSFELTHVVRQKSESGVIANAIPLRQSLQDDVFNWLSIDFGYPDVDEVKHKDLMARYLESCGNKINGESIIIAHSNSDVADYNQRIREHFFPGHAQLMAGEKVMAVSNSKAYEFFISNGDFGLVRQVLGEQEQRSVTLKRKAPETGRVEEMQVHLAFRDVEIGFKDLDGVPHFFRAKVLEDLLYNKEANLSSDQNKALYLDFCIRRSDLARNSLEFKHALKSDPYFNALRLKFGYAITCHKAQGSEWNHVFVNCKSHMSQLTSDYFRWFYTAITRTAEHLYLLDPPNHAPWSDTELVSNPGLGLAAGSGMLKAGLASAPASSTDAAQSSVPDLQDAQGTFGIPESATFLRAMLVAVRERLRSTAIVIDSIQHHQYQEAYVFKRGVELARVDISYSARCKVTNVVATQMTELGSELANLLESLKRAPLGLGSTGAVGEVSFSQPFLNQFHQKVTQLCAEASIVIRTVVEQQWSLRYTFTRAGEIAVYDVWYNGRGRISRCAPVEKACSPGPLMGEVGVLLTQGVRA